MRIADNAWSQVSASTVIHCWHKAGILPSSWTDPESTTSSVSIPVASLLDSNTLQADPVAAAKDFLTDAIEALEEIGMIQRCNRMSIESLLNRNDERVTIEQLTNEEIVKAVNTAAEAMERLDIDGGVDDGEDDSEFIPRPPRKEALRAVATLQRYLAGGEDTKYTQRLSRDLGVFG